MLDYIIGEIRTFAGIQRKRTIGFIIEALGDAADFGAAAYPPGDDAGVIRFGDRYLLLAAEEISRLLLQEDPWWAGFCAVLTNVNDIYAMGGTPLAMVNTASFRDLAQGKAVFAGVREACRRYQVPMVGGHFSPDSDHLTLSAAILGEADTVITSFDAQAGDALVAAVDLKGRQYKTFLNWDCITDKSSAEVLGKLGVMNTIAAQSLANAAKDISNAGMLGTIGMLLETSQKGAVVMLDRIPAPAAMDPAKWFKMYPSYGFIVSASPEKAKGVVKLFLEKGYQAAVIGTVSAEQKMVLRYQGEERLLFDLEKEAIIR